MVPYFGVLCFFPDVVVDGHLPPLTLLAAPLLRLSAHPAQLLVAHLQVEGREEVAVLAVQPVVHVHHAAVQMQTQEVDVQESECETRREQVAEQDQENPCRKPSKTSAHIHRVSQ